MLLGEAQPSAAQWLGEQEVLDPNALSGVFADARFRLTLGGVEQDLMLRDQVAPELVADLGLHADDTAEATVARRTGFTGVRPSPLRTRRSSRTGRRASLALPFGPSGPMLVAAHFAMPITQTHQPQGQDGLGLPLGADWRIQLAADVPGAFLGGGRV